MQLIDATVCRSDVINHVSLFANTRFQFRFNLKHFESNQYWQLTLPDSHTEPQTEGTRLFLLKELSN